MKNIISTGIIQGITDVVRHTYHWGCDWPQTTAEYTDIDARVIRNGDQFQLREDGTPVLRHRSMPTKGVIIGAYVVAVCKQSGASVYMIIGAERLNDTADKYLHRIGITREEVLEATAVTLFLEKSKQAA